jgi:hypothetical protein
VTVSRDATLIGRRERTILLPWFDEDRPSAADMTTLRDALNGTDLAALRKTLTDMNRKSTAERSGGPLRAADLRRVEDLARLLNDRCQGPVEVRGLASSSGFEGGEAGSCGAGSEGTECRNALLANRRATLMASILMKAGVAEVTTSPWDETDPGPMIDRRFDDLDPSGDSPAVAGARGTPGYIARRGAFNRSVELIPENPSCDFDAIQRRLAVVIVERPY